MNKFLKLLYPIKCDLNEQFRKLLSNKTKAEVLERLNKDRETKAAVG